MATLIALEGIARCPVCRQQLQAIHGANAPAWRCACDGAFMPLVEEVDRSPETAYSPKHQHAGSREPRILKYHKPARPGKDGAA